MKKLIILALAIATHSFAQSGMSVRKYGVQEGVQEIKKLIQTLKDQDLLRNDKTEVYEKLNGIIDPIKSKNRQMEYCTSGEYPVSRRIVAEIPFRIGRYQSCKKGLIKLTENVLEAREEFILPVFDSAIKIKRISENLLKYSSDEIRDNIYLSHFLNKFTYVIPEPGRFVQYDSSTNNRIDAEMAIDRIKEISDILPKKSELKDTKNAKKEIHQLEQNINALIYYALNFNLENLERTILEFDSYID